MSNNNLVTPNGIIAVVVTVLAAASTAGTLGHVTSGHVLLYLSIGFISLAVILWAKHYKADLIKVILSVFSRFSKPKWTEYTQDKFGEIIWQWHYKPEFDDTPTPRDLKPHCAECNHRLDFVEEKECEVTQDDEKKLQWMMQWKCSAHPEKTWVFKVRGRRNLFWVYDQIRQKLKDGSWEAVVLKQRAKNSK